ncbi:MAG: hypothetical protein QXX33_00440 [Candidatus Hadarchaeales archaeon]
MPRCCPNCYLFEECDQKGECCEECDFFENGRCALKSRDILDEISGKVK